MERTKHSFMEDLMVSTPEDDLFVNEWSFGSLHHSAVLAAASSDPSFSGLVSPSEASGFPSNNLLNEPYNSFLDSCSYTLHSDVYSSYSQNDSPPFPIISEESASIVEPAGLVVGCDLYGLDNEEINGRCEGAEMDQKGNPTRAPISIKGFSGDRKNRAKKLEGQPSKNLMAERRRRKRLNDRLSMLRSIVPKISKMDRTAILGDTIDYMKELLEKIRKLQEEDVEGPVVDKMKLMGHLKELKPNQIIVRNPPKFDVHRRQSDTKIEICCSAKPGLLSSTLSTLEALGLDIQHSVISCFNEFAMQASCSEVLEHRTIITAEVVRHALFRNAGYGGRCPQ